MDLKTDTDRSLFYHDHTYAQKLKPIKNLKTCKYIKIQNKVLEPNCLKMKENAKTKTPDRTEANERMCITGIIQEKNLDTLRNVKNKKFFVESGKEIQAEYGVVDENHLKTIDEIVKVDNINEFNFEVKERNSIIGKEDGNLEELFDESDKEITDYGVLNHNYFKMIYDVVKVENINGFKNEEQERKSITGKEDGNLEELFDESGEEITDYGVHNYNYFKMLYDVVKVENINGSKNKKQEYITGEENGNLEELQNVKEEKCGENSEEITLEYGLLGKNEVNPIDQLMKMECKTTIGIEEQESVLGRQEENDKTSQWVKEIMIGDNGEEITIEYGLPENNDFEQVDHSRVRIENNIISEPAINQTGTCAVNNIKFYVNPCPQKLANANVLNVDGTLKCFGQKRSQKVERQNSKRNYKCKMCLKSFRQENFLKAHERTHTNRHPYDCKVCDKSFKLKSSLTRHTKNMHDETYKPKAPKERNVKCDICEKAFLTKAHFSVHLRVHTGERPYACAICSKRFKQKSTVKMHMHTHNSEPRFKCKVCTRAFRKKESLRTHEQVHM